ncbi:Z-ring formation inhibitor MciZ [Peribacillus alkalitolerans]|uniref:Z-ring formation inhibitor MciZ n=1 Tax=Peribacillus alkalitolerans TaxID=1550385 RepID=UPI0013D6B902|nr:Z-ring formation inhibitor MciZ [Peribacillus alkalitolerans]
MKIYVHEKGITLSGKAWEIKHKLKEYSQQYQYVQQWIDGISQNNSCKKVKE